MLTMALAVPTTVGVCRITKLVPPVDKEEAGGMLTLNWEALAPEK